MRKFALLVIVAVFIFLGAIPLHADDTELFTAIVSPDALIALDLSGSMLYYPGGDYVYQSTSSCTDTFGYSTSGAGHTDKCSSRYWKSGAWVYYKWSDAACSGPFYDSSGGAHRTDCSKLEIAKRTIKDLLDDSDPKGTLNAQDEKSLNIRMGYMRFYNITQDDSTIDYTTGNNILRRGFDFNYKTLYENYIQGETAEERTALALQLKEAKKYLDEILKMN